MKRKKLIRLIGTNPDYCRYVIETYSFKKFSISQGFSPQDIIGIAILSKNINLLSEAILNSAKPANLRINRKHTDAISSLIKEEIKDSSLFIDFSSRTSGIPFVNEEVVCATAFAASQSEVFIGQNSGVIKVLSISQYGKPIVKYNLWRNVGDQPYSLCYVHDYLYLITEKQAFQISVASNRVIEIPNKPDTLIPPVCTDGHYFYSVRILVRKGKLGVFSFNNGQFISERKLILRGTISDLYQELRIPFISDGMRITFATPRAKSTHFIEFSLESGNLIRDYTTNCPTIINSWCIRPYKLEHVALTNTDVSFFRSFIQTPRWLFTVPFPSNQISLDPYTVISSALYHGAHLFYDEKCSNISELLNFFNERQFIEGIYMCGLLLLDNAPQRNIDQPVEVFVRIYYHTDDPVLKHFCVYLFLYCYSYINNTQMYQEMNILNDYIEKNSQLDFIWFFPNLLDFKCMRLSKYAIDKLIPYVSSNVRQFPQESIFFMSNCCENYIDKLIDADNFENALIPFKAICRSILERINYYLPSIKDPSEFVQSQHFQLWKYILKLTYKLQDHWPRFALDLLEFYQNLLIKYPEENSQNSQLFIMLNRSLYLLIGIVLSAPYQSGRHFFRDLETFYQKNPHPLHRVSSVLDTYLFKLLSESYDITSEKMFCKLFFEIRHRFLFHIYPSKSILKHIQDVESLSSFGLMRYILTKNRNDLCPMSDVSTLSVVMKNFEKSSFKLTEQQQVVFSMYAVQFSKRYEDFIKIGKDVVEHFINSFSFPFFFPPDVLKTLKLSIKVEDFENMNDDLIIKFFNSLLAVFPQLNDINIFVKRFLKKAINPAKFTNQSNEQVSFKATLLMLLAVKSGATIDMKKHTMSFLNCLVGSSPRIITVMMRIIIALDRGGCQNLQDLYEFLFTIVSQYITDNKSIFVGQAELYQPLQSCFIIISHLRDLFNTKTSSLYKYLESIIRKNNISLRPAVFAILNNSLETIRSGVIIRFNDRTEIYHEGKILSRKLNSFDIEVQGRKETYSLLDCSKLWCEPIIKVDLKLINDFSLYYALFANSEKEISDTVEVFKLASLYCFLQVPTFINYCSKDFFINNSIDDIKIERIKPEERFQDFYYSLMINSQNCSQFEFVSHDNTVEDVPISILTKNFVNDSFVDKRKVFSGMMTTMDEGNSFLSNPLHPNTKFTVTFLIYPSLGTRQQPTMCIKLCAYSKTMDCLLESPRVTVINVDDNKPMKFEVIYDPESKMYQFMTDGNEQESGAISPSCHLMFLSVDLHPMMVVEYSLNCDQKIYFANKTVPLSNYKMRVSEVNVEVPITDSCIFNKAELTIQANYISRCFKQMIYLEIMKQRKMNLPAKILLNFFASLNSTESGLPLSLDKIQLFETWLCNEKCLFNSLKNMTCKVSDLIQVVSQKFDSLSDSGFNPEGSTALVVPPGVFLTVMNSYVITGSSYYEVGLTTKTITTKTLTTFIPVYLCNSDFSFVFAQMHYIICLMLRDNNYDFSELLEMINKYSQKLQPFTQLFDSYKRLIELICPPIPAKNIFPEIHKYMPAFLLHESLVHKHPLEFLVPALVLTTYIPSQTKEIVPKFHHSSMIFIRSHGKVTITVESSQKTISLNDGEYLTLNSSFKANYENSDCYLAITELPNINEMTNEIQKWMPHHSHCLFASFPNHISKDDYRYNPLSSKFSFDTADFLFNVTRMVGDETLHQLTLHMIDMSYPKLEELADINKCRIIADSSKNSPLRVKVINTISGSAKTQIDPDQLRLSYAIKLFDNKETAYLINVLFPIIKCNKKKSHSLQWLKSFMKGSSPHVIFMLLDYITGIFGPLSIAEKPIFVWISQDPNLIDVHRDERILILGKFEKKEDLKAKLLYNLQEYSDSLF
ncbi:hypothetical protein TVAG_411000 [Trichomonas vaginalis G3]|uniref:Uncharacterized protein n=1 Tax=Trichomonas vaginalis (strain ATCC PRA-98 / G3) TaxID=412133 RepID=A2DXK5_TRIV3|nr:hypothetical protein TVAGG3_0047980 [Trichomonas vaginalis G3]EAY14834.1 hypothetical protein TVAG_411000 [Trichomonas vaginalis G3]KAI5541185.1 hypothetical protein TVAGG3_0047980 [Trichomonas vaginalis G3]|eukprot:XP_001327057.1 hypothetical protein [Trichomonas vaginalis G3]